MTFSHAADTRIGVVAPGCHERLICAILNAKLNELQTRLLSQKLTEVMNADFKIRTADVADIPALCHLWQERQVILNQTDPRIPTPTAKMRSEVERRFRQRITGSGSFYTGGREDQISGYITGALSNGFGIVDDMALDAHQYQPGLARGLWSTLREHWLTNGVARYAIRVARYDTVAQAFWRSLGAHNFRETSEDKLWTIPTYDQWLIL